MLSKSNVYCEPFCIKQGLDFEIHHVAYRPEDEYTCFMHFHDVHELIIFEQVEGTFYYHQGQSDLHSNDVVFTPAMETHDFELNEGQKSWFIIQFPPELLTMPELQKEALFFQQGMHLRLPHEHQAQLKQVVKWLYQSFAINPLSNKSQSLLKLVLTLLFEHGHCLRAQHQGKLQGTNQFNKIQPVVELFRQQLSVDISLEQAAEMCHLSPSYFSRVFKSVFRFPFSEYATRHKLHNAARLLSQSDKSVTQISYELNFSSPSHFIALYKKQFSITPKQYRMGLLEHFKSPS